MTTVQRSAESALVVKKSRFLSLVSRVKTEEEAQSVIERRRKNFFDAQHHCYAYVLEEGISRFSDDGEPSGTAGRPILEVVKKSGLSDVIVICTRYFGGTLLGAGGLARAYSQCAAGAIKAAGKQELALFSVYKISFEYTVWTKAENLIRSSGFFIDNTEFSDSVVTTVCVKEGYKNNFLELLNNVSLGRARPELMGTKHIEIK